MHYIYLPLPLLIFMMVFIDIFNYFTSSSEYYNRLHDCYKDKVEQLEEKIMSED